MAFKLYVGLLICEVQFILVAFLFLWFPHASTSDFIFFIVGI